MEIKESALASINDLLGEIDRIATDGIMNGKERQSLIDVKGKVTLVHKELYSGVSISTGGGAA